METDALRRRLHRLGAGRARENGVTMNSATADITDRRVLVVDDDPAVRDVVCDYLDAAGLIVDRAADGFSAVEAVRRTRPDAIVLDRMLPGIDGLEVYRRLRAEVGPIPVVMLSALGATDQRIDGLELGIDDYLPKPFSPRELVLRVSALLRRSVDDTTPEAPFRLGRFWLDASNHLVTLDGEPLVLSMREFDLLAYLLKHPDRVLSRDQLLRAVWGWEFGDRSTVTVHVRRLREKVEADPSNPTTLQTVWGVGYRFVSEVAA
ncbi:DNA-binding response regulator [Pseudolysinimonas kribbensis]|uniref:DNA-binding response regulator n=2 Tax=Pseudolysinimonas kribbensis TaxID=433641 RepID=A0ABQ6K5C9_9MICO|nr:DNA-binding response regulator [Pseudolysinimonas kribbensis]